MVEVTRGQPRQKESLPSDSRKDPIAQKRPLARIRRMTFQLTAKKTIDDGHLFLWKWHVGGGDSRVGQPGGLVQMG